LGRHEAAPTDVDYLNAEGVRPHGPRRNRNLARSWAMSAVQTLLENPLYNGEFVYGPTRSHKAHSTGERHYRPVPESEWFRRPMPELAIVTPELWARVREVKRAKRVVYRMRPAGGFATTRGHPGRRCGRHLLAGFLSCGECGGSCFALHGTSSAALAARDDLTRHRYPSSSSWSVSLFRAERTSAQDATTSITPSASEEGFLIRGG
jgi:hypothetical protein